MFGHIELTEPMKQPILKLFEQQPQTKLSFDIRISPQLHLLSLNEQQRY